ncbi:aldo/keto reductase [Candidatus Sumerlaeota bacterium]|nr:aldo/keto reductase [Candidatus Sumerlaeota bacterium]
MQYRSFGKTGLKVSALSLGASHVGNSNVSEDEAGSFLNAVLDRGINLVDTARMYGLSEERIGRHISHRRKDYILSSKCGYHIPGTEDWTRECVTKGVDHALNLMRTDVIDIMHLHSCGLDILHRGEVTEALLDAKRAGKIRFAAYSGENEERAYAIETGAFDVIQTSVNICDQRVISDALPELARNGTGVIAKRPIANAFWTHEKQPTGSYCEPYWLRAKDMDLQNPAGIPWDEFALRFSAFLPGVHTCIVGTSKLSNLDRNLAIVDKEALPQDIIDATRALFKKHDQNWRGQI